MKFLTHFTKDQDGAITVDWVVLTAAVVALAAFGVTGVLLASDTLAGKVETVLSDATVQ